MVELVDTQDLKSCDHCDRAGSIPAPGTIEFKIMRVRSDSYRNPLRVLSQGLVPGSLTKFQVAILSGNRQNRCFNFITKLKIEPYLPLKSFCVKIKELSMTSLIISIRWFANFIFCLMKNNPGNNL